MARNEYHVTPDTDGGWKINQAGRDKAVGHFDRKEDAVARAREICSREKAELVIHDREGKIQQKDSYGHDPANIKG